MFKIINFKRNRFNVYDRCFDKYVFFFFFRYVYGEVVVF